MRGAMRDKLNTEITRKQFLQYMVAALLAVFGFGNLLSLLTGNGHEVHRIFVPDTSGLEHNGFGTRKFGV